MAFAATIRPTKTTSERTHKSAAYPTKAELLKTLPPELSKLSPIKAWMSLVMSVGLSSLAVGVGTLIPLSAAATPLWLLYGAVTGTIAMGCWVIAHECGHHAFHPNRRIEGIVGFALHSILLVPYYSWAHSHAVHHAHCNHLEKGETHVPPRATSPLGKTTEQLKQNCIPSSSGLSLSSTISSSAGSSIYFLEQLAGKTTTLLHLIFGMASESPTESAACFLKHSKNGWSVPILACWPWFLS
ncbi:fatty acid desaturase [Synechococcus sp. UW69]|uniref:fatty acid desaturase n=1 Tax=Synechococcus sp. UW69 TaxID=368493 RepID=UPI001FCB5FBB|nr:fatty acid desaturase [Synechococcus sp. UW69]